MALNDNDYTVLCNELKGTHPVTGLPYDPSNSVAAQQLNEKNISGPARMWIEASELLDLIDGAEMLVISNNATAHHAALTRLLGMVGSFGIDAGSTARVVLEGIFGPASQTRTNLNTALGGNLISRGEELTGEANIRPADVDRARNGGYC